MKGVKMARWKKRGIMMTDEQDKTNRARRSFLGKVIGIFGASFLFSRQSHSLSSEQIVRAWEDPEYRNSLTESQWNMLPENPAGKIERSEFSGGLLASGNNCSGNNCSGNNCSGNNCSGNSCSGNNCSGNNCSGNNCSGNNCSGNNCSGNNCGQGGDDDDW